MKSSGHVSYKIGRVGGGGGGTWHNKLSVPQKLAESQLNVMSKSCHAAAHWLANGSGEISLYSIWGNRYEMYCFVREIFINNQKLSV